ncbi:hypothetical protein [Vreelandella titanicae]|uniref:Uncharacterized protein n=1 Tax=Vreelandella titanicae TaxID=664683 RepID=A0A558J2P9_9GAMM|nr:hypothetical protein [Halomonas titanicae]TVU87897.1 hypothetical protein FQP89_20185 [Halomonas titanicae]
MANRVWIPALAAVALLLSACGDSQDDPSVTPDDNAAVTDEEPTRDEGAGEEEVPDAAENAADMSSPEEVEDDIEARQAAEELERAEALREDDTQSSGGVSGNATADGEEVEAGEDTLAANPEDVLDEEGAMPGEATRSDVDEIIAETERRFEEAEQRLEEQFQEVEQQSPSLEPMESEDVSPSWDTESSLPERTPLQDDREATDVDALIEDTERRFEEAQQRLEEQYQELENREAESGAVVEPSSELGSDVESSENSQESGANGDSRSDEG